MSKNLNQKKQNTSLGCKEISAKRVMIFDLAMGGHHPTYIRHLLDYLQTSELNLEVYVVVAPLFLDKYSDIVSSASSSVRFIPVSQDEAAKRTSAKRILSKSFLDWSMYCKYAEKLSVDHGILMYIDHLLLPIIFGFQSPCTFSGIYFRPSFHYDFISSSRIIDKKTKKNKGKKREYLRSYWQKIILRSTLKNERLNKIFSLDQYAISFIKEIVEEDVQKYKVSYLPDPVSKKDFSREEILEFGQKLKIPSGKKIFLLCGQITERKGVFQTLSALELLDEKTAEKMCLLIAGNVSKKIQDSLLSKIQQVQDKTRVHISLKDEYISYRELHLYFSLSDIVLALYQRHVGMSGIIALGASYQKPILSSDYGLMGRIVEEKKLGLTCDSTRIDEISQSFTLLTSKTCMKNFNSNSALDYSESQSAQKFSQLLLDSSLMPL